MFKNRKIRKKDILADKSIKTISAENIDKDSENIKVIVDVAPSHKKGVIKFVTSLMAIAISSFLIISAIVLFLNTTIVQGHVEGAIVEIGGFSIVDDDYNPAHYLSAGKTVYYDGENNGFFYLDSAFKEAKVSHVINNHVYLEGSIKETSININEIDYVLKDSN